MIETGWIGVGLDGTLAHYDTWKGPAHIGDPVPAMARRVEQWIDRGIQVRIFTERVWSDGTPEKDAEAAFAYSAIQQWTRKHFGTVLPVTCVKDFNMIALYDARALHVEKNTGRITLGDGHL